MTKDIQTLDDLTPDDRNANKGTPRGQYMVQHSLEQYGAGRSILVDKHGKIIAGNKTTQAAQEMALPVRVVQSDGRELIVVQRTDLDLDNDAAARALAVADNRASEVGLEWDAEVLGELAQEVDLSKMFFPEELSAILEDAGSALLDDAEPPEAFKEYGEDVETQYCCPKCGYEWSGKPK